MIHTHWFAMNKERVIQLLKEHDINHKDLDIFAGQQVPTYISLSAKRKHTFPACLMPLPEWYMFGRTQLAVFGILKVPYYEIVRSVKEGLGVSDNDNLQQRYVHDMLIECMKQVDPEWRLYVAPHAIDMEGRGQYSIDYSYSALLPNLPTELTW